MSGSISKFDFTSRAIPLPEDFMPKENDVICGRGNAYCHLPSNILFTSIIRLNMKKYSEMAERPRRSTFVTSVLQQVEKEGLRFVKRDRKTKQWFEFCQDQVHEKVGHALRDMIARNKDDDTSVESNRSSKASRSRKSMASQAKREARESHANSMHASPRSLLSNLEDESNHTMESGKSEAHDGDEVNPLLFHHNFTEASIPPMNWDLTPLRLSESQDGDEFEALLDNTLDRDDYVKALQILSLEERVDEMERIFN